MKKILTLLTLTFITVSFTFANIENDPKVSADSKQVVSLQGKIIDKTNAEPLTGALVKIVGTNFETYTDFEGNFSFQNITPGLFNLNISLVSYKDNFIKDINISSENQSVIKITIDN